MANRREQEKRKARRLSASEWTQQKEAKQFEATAVQLPEGVEAYKLEPGKHRIDFMPYLVTKGNDVKGGNPRVDSGFEHYERGFVLHWVPSAGGKNKPYICRDETFGKKCAVCTWLTKHGQTAEEEMVKTLKKKFRCLWIVNDKPGGKKPAFKILDTFRFNRGVGFEELMNDALAELPENAYPFSLQGGYTATIIVKEQTGGGFKSNAVTRISLHPHDYNYPDGLLEAAPNLDECLIDPGFEKVAALLERGESDEEEQEETRGKPSRNGKPKHEEEEDEDESDEIEEPSETEEDTEDEPTPKRGKKEPTAEDLDLNLEDIITYRGKECSITKISKDGTSLTLEGKPGQFFKAIAPSSIKKVTGPDEDEEDLQDDSELEDEDDELPAPKKNGKKPAVEEEDDEDLVMDDDSEDSDYDADEEEEVIPPKKRGRR